LCTKQGIFIELKIFFHRDYTWDHEPKSVDVEETQSKKVSCRVAEHNKLQEEAAQVGNGDSAKLISATEPLPSMTVTLFLTSGWREALCKCADCSKMYSAQDLEFLLDCEDTVHHYEEKSRGPGEGEVAYIVYIYRYFFTLCLIPFLIL